MSLYTWGSTGHGALGYICSHTCPNVRIPRLVDCQREHRFSQISTGKTNTWTLTSTGEVIVFGRRFGPVQSVEPVLHGFEFLSCSPSSPVAICIQHGNSEVFWVTPEGSNPIVHGGNLLRGSAVACRDESYGLVIDVKSSVVIEIGSSVPCLCPSHVKLISPASAVFVSELFGAAVSAETTEVRIWDHGCVILSKPARVRVRPGVDIPSSSEWMDVSDEHFLKNVSLLSLPNSCDTYGYAVEKARPHVLIRFSLSNNPHGEQVSTVFGEPYIYMPDRLGIVSVSQNDSDLYIVDSAGALFRIPHHFVPQTDRLSSFKILDQVTQISVSNNHCAAIVSERVFHVSKKSLASLQHACSVSLMEHNITVENVTRILLALLSRAVVDLGIFFDFCYALFSSNRGLIQYIAPEDYAMILEIEEFVRAQDRMMKGHVSFSEALIRCRAEFEPATVQSPPVRRLRKKDRKNIVTEPRDDSTPEPMICLRIVDSQMSTEDEVCVDESFVALGEAVTNLEQKKTENFRVRKWSKCDNQKVFGDPSLVSPVIAPWSPPQSVSPSSTVTDLVLPETQSRKSKSSTPSRWYRQSSTSVSVQDAMLEAIEEREIAEAIRLVEEFEKRENNGSAKNRKRNAQFNRIIARH